MVRLNALREVLAVAQLIGTIIAASVAFVYGLIALAYPYGIQRWLTPNRLQRKVSLRVYGRMVESPKYIRHLRITGAISVIISSLLVYFAFVMASKMGR